MSTWLLVWNPRLFDWPDRQEQIAEIEEGREAFFEWSCGRTKRIEEGDRVYLIRLGEEPRGLIGSGTVIEGPFEGESWNPKQQTTLYIEAAWDHLSSVPVISREELRSPPFSDVHWSTQTSGIEITEPTASILHNEWDRRTGDFTARLAQEDVPAEHYEEGGVRALPVSSYERSPAVREKCLAANGLRCRVCDTSLAERYGPSATGIIHVHHLVPLAHIQEKRPVDPARDLCPICPNCHAVVHSKEPPYTIDEVRGMLRRD